MNTSKTTHWLVRPASILAASALALTATSCMNTYDAYGRPQQSVDPGVAIAGAAAAGVAGYALANRRESTVHHYHAPAPRYYHPPPRRRYYHY